MAPSACAGIGTKADSDESRDDDAGGPRVTLRAAMHFSLQRDGESLQVELVGSWRGVELPAIDAELAAQSFAGARRLVVTVSEDVELDLAGAWTLREWLKSAENAGLTVEFSG